MLKYIVKRLLWMIPIVLGVLLIVFVLSAITPGDPLDVIVGTDAEYEVREAARIEYGLDKPVTVRFFSYIFGIVTRFDFGKSYASGLPVIFELSKRFPVTVKLTLLAVGVALVIALPLGVLSAVKQYSWIDNVTMVAALFFVSIPQFWFALMLMLAFCVKLKWFPASNITGWSSWVLPVAMAGVSSVGNLARVTRSTMLEIIRQDYMRTARAKGQKSIVVTFKHGLRNALMPVLANVGNSIGVSLGGAVIAESIFSIPGIGQYMLGSINSRDWPAVQGGLVLLAVSFSIVMLLVDIAYTIVDPRLRSEFKMDKKKKAKAKSVKEVSA
ncbi:MAG: ABC transporter permease [Oscillospiraceae bacterium]|nr:ABC transporter permease [Oscillospiraceae bacterium]